MYLYYIGNYKIEAIYNLDHSLERVDPIQGLKFLSPDGNKLGIVSDGKIHISERSNGRFNTTASLNINDTGHFWWIDNNRILNDSTDSLSVIF